MAWKSWLSNDCCNTRALPAPHSLSGRHRHCQLPGAAPAPPADRRHQRHRGHHQAVDPQRRGAAGGPWRQPVALLVGSAPQPGMSCPSCLHEDACPSWLPCLHPCTGGWPRPGARHGSQRAQPGGRPPHLSHAPDATGVPGGTHGVRGCMQQLALQVRWWHHRRWEHNACCPSSCCLAGAAACAGPGRTGRQRQRGRRGQRRGGGGPPHARRRLQHNVAA